MRTMWLTQNIMSLANSVRPGDTVEVEATLDVHRANIYICSAKLSVGGKLCVRGELSFALLPDTRKTEN